MSRKVYIVHEIDPCGYDSWECSHHLTRKGALKFIIDSHYDDWMRFRYITPGGYDDRSMYITDRELRD